MRCFRQFSHHHKSKIIKSIWGHKHPQIYMSSSLIWLLEALCRPTRTEVESLWCGDALSGVFRSRQDDLLNTTDIFRQRLICEEKSKKTFCTLALCDQLLWLYVDAKRSLFLTIIFQPCPQSHKARVKCIKKILNCTYGARSNKSETFSHISEIISNQLQFLKYYYVVDAARVNIHGDDDCWLMFCARLKFAYTRY